MKHYHIKIIIHGIVLVFIGVIIAIANSIEVRLALLLVVVSTLVSLWRTASMAPQQLERFFLALRNRDFMVRFPKSRDKEIQKMYSQMNEVMRQYSTNMLDIETKRLYYDRILRVMTHELRNSITPVISLTKDMIKRPANYEGSNRDDALTIIVDQCASIKSFLDAYFDLTHLPKPSICEVNVKSLFEKTKKLMVVPDNIHVDFFYPENMVIMADSNLLAQVVINILKNATEALVDVTEPRVIVRASLGQDNSIISIGDNGPGVPLDQRTSIFLPFYTTKNGGSGVSLCLSRQIINLHRGDLSCGASELGGAEFVISIPIVAQ